MQAPHRVAIIDLGTNVFRVYIFEKKDADAPFERRDALNFFVEMASGGTHFLENAAQKRGLAALRAFREKMDEWGVSTENCLAFGTSAIRTAANGQAFLDQIFEQTGIRAEAISGEREAELIFIGVQNNVALGSEKAMVMDIGGGSCEFICGNENGQNWGRSFQVGAAVLFQKMHRSDPITDDQIAELEAFLEIELADLWAFLEETPLQTLIGTAGSFDVLEAFLLPKSERGPAVRVSEIPLESVFTLIKKLEKTSLTQRRAMPELPEARVTMIVVALVLIRKILVRGGFERLRVSASGMKDGMLLISDLRFRISDLPTTRTP